MMVGSTTRALAGGAASAARKVIGRRPRASAAAAVAAEPAPEPAAVKAPVKKAPVKKVPAKKTPAAKKAPARTTTAQKIPTTSKATTTKVTTAKKTPATTRPQAVKKAPKGAMSQDALLKSLVVKEGEDPWTKAELQEVIDELHEAQTHSLALLEEAEAGLDGLMRDSGDGAGQDQADMGATTFERDHELTVVNSERDKLAQIERALSHIDDGTYGVCESCGEPIGKLRVMAFPRATLCMTCKQREERR